MIRSMSSPHRAASSPAINVEGQKKVYTKWIQHKIKEYNADLVPEIDPKELIDALSDGVVFLRLIQALTKRVPIVSEEEYRKAMSNNIKKQTALTQIFEYAKKSIKPSGHSITCSPQNLMEKKDHNLVLGLIWVLILAYQHIKKDDQVKWLQSRLSNIPGINITDLSSSFQDGMAFAHLIHSFKPEAIDLDEISQFKIPDRLETSFSKAEQHLGIPRLLEPSDCYPDRPSEQSIMTYLSFFHNVSRQEEGEVFFDTVTPPVTPSKPESTTTPQTTPSKVDAATATLDQKKLDFGDSDALKSEIETLRRENSYLKDAQIPELRTTLDSLRPELEKAKEQLSASELDNADLKAQVEKLKSQISSFTAAAASNGAAEAHIKELERKIQTYERDEIPDLRYDIEQRDKQIAELEAKLKSAASSDSLTKLLEDEATKRQAIELKLTEEVESLREELEGASQLKIVSERENAGLKAQLAQALSDSARQSELLREATSQVATLREQVAALDRVKTDLEIEKEKRMTSIKDSGQIQDQLAEVQAQLVLEKDKRTRSETEMEALHAKLSSISTEATNAQAEVTRLRSQLETEQKRSSLLEQSLSQIEEEKRTLAKRLTESEKMFSSESERASALEKENKLSREDLNKNTSEMDSLKEELNNIQLELRSARTSVATKTAEMAKLSQDTVASLNAALSEKAAEIESLGQEIQKLRLNAERTSEELASAQSIREEQQSEICKMREDRRTLIQEMKDAMQKLLSQQDADSARIAGLQKKVAEYSSTVSVLSQMTFLCRFHFPVHVSLNSSSMPQVIQLKQKIDEKGLTNIEEMERELSGLSIKNENLEREVLELQRQIEQAQREAEKLMKEIESVGLVDEINASTLKDQLDAAVKQVQGLIRSRDSLIEKQRSLETAQDELKSLITEMDRRMKSMAKTLETSKREPSLDLSHITRWNVSQLNALDTLAESFRSRVSLALQETN